MNWRWYFTVFIVALAVFGMGMEQSNADPNQEILVQFNSKSISAEQTERAVSDIKNHLKAIGVEDVQVSQTLDGRLKVSYYSTIDIAVIKDLFSGKKKFPFHDVPSEGKGPSSEIPFSQDSYVVDVVKIQNDFNFEKNLQAVIVEIKSANDQYVKPKFPLNVSDVILSIDHPLERKPIGNFRDISLFIDNASYNFPEVRAGPLA